MKKILFIALSLTLFFFESCRKIESKEVLKESIDQSEDNYFNKNGPEFLHDATRILIPGLAGPYIGSLTDGHIPDIGINNPAWPTSPNPYFVWSVGNSANNSIWLVQNTLGASALPSMLGGIVFHGLAVDNRWAQEVWLCRSSGGSHYMYHATKTPTNYSIDLELQLSTPFISGNSWRIHDIEGHDGTYYGIFTGGSQSIVASIDITTGICTAIKNMPVKISGMDFNWISNQMYLSSPGVNQTVNYGVLHVLDLVTLTTTTFPLILPVPAIKSINTMH